MTRAALNIELLSFQEIRTILIFVILLLLSVYSFKYHILEQGGQDTVSFKQVYSTFLKLHNECSCRSQSCLQPFLLPTLDPSTIAPYSQAFCIANGIKPLHRWSPIITYDCQCSQMVGRNCQEIEGVWTRFTFPRTVIPPSSIAYKAIRPINQKFPIILCFSQYSQKINLVTIIFLVATLKLLLNASTGLPFCKNGAHCCSLDN